MPPEDDEKSTLPRPGGGAGGGRQSGRAGPHRATDDRTWAVPVALADDDQGHRVATILALDDPDDLLGFARAEALALLPPHSGPWQGGEVVKIAPLGPFLLGA